MPRLAVFLPALLLWGGCVQCEHSFPEVQLTRAGTLSVAPDLPGDTLTVAVVSGAPARLGPLPIELYAVPDTLQPERLGGSSVELAYAVDGFGYDQTPAPRLTAAVEGDTVFVFEEGAFDPVREACPPSEGPYAEVVVRSVGAPEGVRAVVVTTVDAGALAPRTAAALRQRDAERPRPMVVA